MSSTTIRRRVHKITQAKFFDKYALYQKAVQSSDTDVLFLRQIYQELRKKEPRVFREDFCGTFALSCEWVKLNSRNKAHGIDLDPEPLGYGKQNNLKKLKEAQQKRVHLIEGDVLTSVLAPADISVAMNFSYFIFKTRLLMKKYFQNVHRALKKDGLFVLDIFGGSLCYQKNEEKNVGRKFTYYWHQEGFDPVSNEAVFHIHFRLKNQKKIEQVFSYDWRLWSIPELKELLEEIGFKKTHVYWEGTTRKGEGDGEFIRVEKVEACQAWIAYIVAEK